MTQSITIADVVRLLNDINAADPAVLPALLNFRVPCNEALAVHPTVQVGETGRGPVVGLLGILNGLFDHREDDWSWIVANIDAEGIRITHFECFVAPYAISEPEPESVE